MSPRIAVVLGLVLAFIVLGFAIVAVQRGRLNANLEASRNNLRQLALFAAHHTNPDEKPQFKVDLARLPQSVPAATVVLPGTPPENRLSWVVSILPAFDQRRNPSEKLLAEIKLDQQWNAEPNQQAARTRLPVLLCPENLPETPPGSPAITCYVGIAGVGSDAATLALAPGMPAPPRAGAFRYDEPTPFDCISDGVSETLLIGETANSPGPWLQGGPATTRGFDDAAGAKPLLGMNGQFGGFFPNATNFAMCDGSVRAFTPRTTPDVLLKLATIAGGKAEMVPEN
ncbi:MAG: DUF1559 domain-containing protein [Gemmataceae bacterium]